jgi:alkylation response protein AidB-like acyl-CoA dehydrogenase
MSLVLVEGDAPGFKRGGKLQKLGLRAQDTSILFFEDVRIPAHNVLGPLHGGFGLLMKELPQERLLIADMAQASSEAAFETTREYLHSR